MAQLAHTTVDALLAGLAAKSPAPGGGAAAALAGALAAALGRMPIAYTSSPSPAVSGADRSLDAVAAELLRLADRDAEAYGTFAARRTALGPAWRDHPDAVALANAVIDVPLNAARAAVDALEHVASLPGLTNRRLDSDLAVAAILAEACVRSAAWNVRVNLPLAPTAERRDAALHEAADLVVRARRLTDTVEHACAANLTDPRGAPA